MKARTKTPASPGLLPDDAHWAAMARRDAGANAGFLYAVVTTGVYCRPDCAARLPRRQNVRFHVSCADAELAGFRACKRCRPDAAQRLAA